MTTITSVPLPQSEPDTLTIGDTWAWTRRIVNYTPASGWALSYALLSATAGPIKFSSTDNGDGQFKIEVDASVTATYASGEYDGQAYVSNSVTGERYKVFDWHVTLEPNFTAQTGALDTRSHVKKTLDALEAVISGRATVDQQHYSIAGRSLSRMSVKDLHYWRDKYRAYWARELRRQRRARGLSSSGKIRARFNETTFPLNGSQWPRGTE